MARVITEKRDTLTRLPYNYFKGYVRNSIMKKINCSTPKHPNMFALIDDCDYEELSKYKWYVKKRLDTFYAARTEYVDSGQKEIRMHRDIMKAGDFAIDHINRNGLDNQRKNLRVCDARQNAGNRKLHRDNKSGFRGVTWDSQKLRWRARLFTTGGCKGIGFYICPLKAASDYDKDAKEYFGEFYEPQVLAAVLCEIRSK